MDNFTFYPLLNDSNQALAHTRFDQHVEAHNAYAWRRDVGNVRNRALACNRDLHLHRGCAGSSLISYPSVTQRGALMRLVARAIPGR